MVDLLGMLKPSTPFTMNGAFVEAIIQRGRRSYSLSSINGMANSLTSMRMKLLPGAMASSVELTLNPPFEVAKKLLESGMLGTGTVPTDELDLSLEAGLSLVADLFEDPVSDIFSAGLPDSVVVGKGSNVFKPPVRGTATAIKVRWFYNQSDSFAMSPIFYGTMRVPRITFGEEISIAIQADSAGALSLAMLDDVGNTKMATTLYSHIEELADKVDLYVDWAPDARRLAMMKKLKSQQDLPLLMYLGELLSTIGCMAYFGADPEDDEPMLQIVSFNELKARPPVCTLRMYGQIDPNASPPIYPISSVDADISLALAQGVLKGSNHTSIDTNKKEAQTNSNNVNSTEIKNTLGNTTAGALPNIPKIYDVSSGEKGTSKQSGFQDKSVITNKDHPDRYKEKQIGVDMAVDRAFEMTMSGPGIPWLTPNMLVRVDIGGIKFLTGNYIFKEIEHVVDGNGAESTFHVYKGLGQSDAESYGLSLNNKKPVASGGLAGMAANLTSGLIS